MKSFFHKYFFLLAFIEGLLVLIVLAWQRSEEKNALFLGFSAARLALMVFIFICLLTILWLQLKQNQPNGLFKEDGRLIGWLLSSNHLFWTCAAMLLCTFLSLLSFFFTYLFIPPPLRSVIVWMILIFLQSYLVLRITYAPEIKHKEFANPVDSLPRLSRLSGQQRKILSVLLLIGLLYFLAFFIPNLIIEKDDTSLIYNLDEQITYTYVTWMLSPAKDMYEAVYTWFIYEDYHYGYPFYFLSALVLLPVRILFGADFKDHLALNLLLLRQFISVLPMILSSILLVYLQTRFKNILRTVGLYLLLLFIPAVVSHNIRFWHPDALVVLTVVLVLFFLDADRMRFGINFYAAAAACGLAAAIKLYGFFFFLAILGYLIAGIIRKQMGFRQFLQRGIGFVLVMIFIIILVNPFLLMSQPRARAFEIIQEKQGEMVAGYPEPDPHQMYAKNPLWSLLFLERGYGSLLFLGFLGISLIAGSLWGKRRLISRLILAWMIPVSIYLVFFIAYKSYIYWLPVMLPFYSCGLGLAFAFERGNGLAKHLGAFSYSVTRALNLILWVVIASQLAQNLALSQLDWQDWHRWRDIFLVEW